METKGAKDVRHANAGHQELLAITYDRPLVYNKHRELCHVSTDEPVNQASNAHRNCKMPSMEKEKHSYPISIDSKRKSIFHSERIDDPIKLACRLDAQTMEEKAGGVHVVIPENAADTNMKRRPAIKGVA
ncbi:hypothetical protein HAX54_009167 [Datura stramonium]|uniref:Uncharacterized protein n=1 Tax=Datura stramonium TaxID=4076 RepID=A0ABS8TEF3_DATST|nr:hypothetical protein [Datura stramonium]